MKSFRSFLTEARITSSEQKLLDKFTSADQKMEIGQYKGTGRATGGGSPRGKKEFENALSLIKKGVLQKIGKVNYDRYWNTVYVKYPGWQPRDLNDLEIIIYNQVKRYNEGPKNYNFRQKRPMRKKEKEAFEHLAKMGYISNDFQYPKILKDLPK